MTLATRLAFTSEIGDGFTRAVERCVGMGKCRSAQGGTMCPSYRATREERYSTRGRARLLGEMLRGELITERWDSEAVREALDWCLACKGCKSDCPTHTDMAAYKAEFLHHHYATRTLPRQAHTMGRIGEWAPLAARLPQLVNFLAQAPAIGALAKRIAGIASQRSLPRLSARSFRSRSRMPQAAAGEPVLLFADTFNDCFRAETAVAAVRVLQHAGCRVEWPRSGLCCGRPYYDFGLLDRARAALEKIVAALAPQIDAGTPVIVLEPACLSVFRDEMRQMLPNDARAARLATLAVSLAEFLAARGWQPPPLAGRAFVHGHCHQKALGGQAADLALLAAAGLDVEAPDSGCCGMSGAFGFKPEHFAASQAIGELSLLPAVRAQAPETLIVASGFSCREQIEQLTGRATLHLAEVLARALP